MHTYPWKKYILAQPVSLPPGGEGGGHKAWEKKQNSTHLNIQMYNVTVVNVINCFHNLLYKAHCFIFRQVVLFNQELK